MASDEAVFRSLVRDMTSVIRATLNRHFGDLSPQDREDIEQEVRVKLWTYHSLGKKSAGDSLYVRRMVMSTAIDAVRMRRRKTPPGPPAPPWEEQPELLIPAPAGDTPQGRLEERELRRTIVRAINRLASNRRRVIKLHVAGLSISETAKLLSWSENKVRHLLYRGLENLRRGLRQEGLEGAPACREAPQASAPE